ncbi:hypothetical protein QBC33DRAFT_516482 [Phialemonium atrogriseum]|uniref:Mid2 domain-containing protein n=1 Tax=Phialemonium atrogriseum TaxID=1093897 RepID=A0AAJ0BWI4_9PEZI|nr:uncharacterized protein QBC33DRAFT_516482 [Phialemonium atrogriseum]KAK1765595.1 hypothetical protein QBC33DRAFT_516482 [Phialemonium atrogriseum]
MVFLFLFLLLPFMRPTSNADSADEIFGNFIHPPAIIEDDIYGDNLIFRLGDVEELRWTTDWDSYNLRLYQRDIMNGNTPFTAPGTTIFSKPQNQAEPGGLNWTVQTYTFDLDISPVFILEIENSAGDSGFSSHSFNISSKRLVTSTAPPTPSSKPESPTTDAGSASGLDLRLPLGLGLGLGIPLVALASFVLGYFVFNLCGRLPKEEAEKPSQRQTSPHGNQPPYEIGSGQPAVALQEEPIYYEADPSAARLSELPGEQGRKGSV